MKVLLPLIRVGCPLLAMVWFLLSLNWRIDAGWEYISRPKQLEFGLFKVGVAFLLLAPIATLFKVDDSPGNSAMLTMGMLPALILLKEAVAGWMITLTEQLGRNEAQVPLGYQLTLCLMFTIIGLGFGYGPWLMRKVMVRKAMVASRV